MSGLQRFSRLFRTLSASVEHHEDPEIEAEYADALRLMSTGFDRAGPDAAVYSAACTVQSFVMAAEDRTIKGVSEKVIRVNRDILRTMRDFLEADEREAVDRMVAEYYERVADKIRGDRYGR